MIKVKGTTQQRRIRVRATPKHCAISDVESAYFVSFIGIKQGFYK